MTGPVLRGDGSARFISAGLSLVSAGWVISSELLAPRQDAKVGAVTCDRTGGMQRGAVLSAAATTSTLREKM